jgi:hypothetical protein
MAAFLLACFGMLIPTVASPLRVCLLEERLLVAEVHSDSNCCSDCTRETDDRNTCCLDLEALPDSSAPQPSISLPPVIITDLPAGLSPLPPRIEIGDGIPALPEPVRGTAPPSTRRAVLGVWRM